MPLNFVAKLAVTAVLTAAQMAITMTRTIEGPRLDDLKGSTAGYGTPHPNGLGLVKTAAPCFFCEPIKEKKKKRKTKGGKYKEYTYFGTWAAMVCGHEIQHVRRIWFDKHLVYDATGGGITSIGDDADTVESLDGNNTGLSNLIRIYLGTEEQEPDPRMLATVEANEGADTCSAYKGIAYIFFEDVPLEKVGNRFPQVEVEFIGVGESVLDFTTVDGFLADPDYDNQFIPAAVSPNGRYVFSGTGTSWMTLDRNTDTITTAFDPLRDSYHAHAIDDDGTVYALLSGSSDLYSFGNFGNDAGVFLASPSDLSVNNTMRLFNVGGSNKIVWPAQTTPAKGIVVYDIDTDTLTELANPDAGSFFPWLIVQDSYGDVWASGPDIAINDTFHFWRVVDNGGGSAAPDHVEMAGFVSPVGNENDLLHTPSGWFLSDSTDLYLLDEDDFSITLHRSGYAASGLYYPVSTIDFLRGVPAGLTEFWFLGRNSTSAYVDVEKIRASDLATIDSHPLSEWDIGDTPLGLAYSSYGNPALVSANTNFATSYVAVRYFTPSSVILTLGDVIRHFSGLVGHVEDTDYTIHASVDAIIVDGLGWTQGQAKQGFDWLIDIYDVIARPHDGVTQFIARGVASSFTLTTPEFVIERGQPENRYKLTVSNDTDMPAQVTFNFADLGNDLEPNNVSSGRDEQATDATGKMSIDGTTLTLAADNAQQMVDRYFRSKWFRRARSENRVSNERLAIEPGDVGTIDFDGLALKVEVEKARLSADGSIYLECLQYDQALAGLSEGVGSPAMGRPNSEIFSPGASTGFVLDLPLLTDAHDQSAPFLYVAGGPEDPDAQYIGTDFSQSDTGDPDTFEPGWAGTGSSDPATYGATTTELPDALPWVMDNGSTLTVVLADGTMSSVTEDQLYNNAALNMALVGDELIQFKTATLTAPLTYNLSGLLRGRRGTEHHMTNHSIGDRFIVLDSAIAMRTIGASEIGDTDYYIPAAPGSTPDVADVIALDFAANAHRPYAPVYGSLTLDSGSGDWSIDATRRTRIGGAALDNQDVPLGEASEAWEADVYDGPTFKRTISGTSLPMVYTNAMQVTDFGSPQVGGFEVNLYQMNPTLSLRGIPLALAA